MGYTHYWELDAQLEKDNQFARAVTDMSAIVSASSLLADWDGDGEPEIRPDSVVFNGIGDDSYETFEFESFERSKTSLNGYSKHFHFCKTAQKPYDIVVTACLAVAADVLGERITVSSDGYAEDWEVGARLASDVLGREIQVPSLNR